MARLATRISSERLRAIQAATFHSRRSTLADEAWHFRLADLEATLVENRREIRQYLEMAPDPVFDLQPEYLDEPVWSAGQIVSHIRDVQMNDFLRLVRVITGLPTGQAAPQPDDDHTYPALNRIASIAALDEADRDLLEVLGSIPFSLDADRRIQHETLGDIGLIEMLLLLAIHDDEHLTQLRQLTVAMPEQVLLAVA